MKQKVIVPTVALIFVFSSVRGYALESRNDWDKVMQKYLFDIPKYPKFQFVQLDIEKPSRNYTKVYTFGKKIYGDYKLDYWNYSIDYEKIVDDGYCIFYNISLSHGEFVVQQSSEIGSGYIHSGGIGESFTLFCLEAKQTSHFRVHAEVHSFDKPSGDFVRKFLPLFDRKPNRKWKQISFSTSDYSNNFSK